MPGKLPEKPPLDPGLQDLLHDPLIRMVMKADGVEEHVLGQVLRDHAARLDSAPGLKADADQAPIAYRYGVGVMLLDAAGRVFVARRHGRSDGSWQMPQGGIEPGETPDRAALRELAEEIGTDRAEILGQSMGWLRYDLPEAYRAGARHPGFRGQVQKWLALRFTGQDADICLETEEPEFSEWRWVAPDAVVARAAAFRRPVYTAVLAEFAPFLGQTP